MSSRKKSEITRRRFIETSAMAGLTVGMSAKSYGRILGANDRINIAFLGCGSRSRGHMRMTKGSYKDKNLQVVAVCDIWTQNREKAAASCKKLFDTDVKQYKYSEDLLKQKDLLNNEL